MIEHLWLAVDLDAFVMATAALFFLFACWASFVAAEFANASGPSAAGPGASPDVDPSAPGDAPSSLGVDGWAAGPAEESPAPLPSGGPSPT